MFGNRMRMACLVIGVASFAVLQGLAPPLLAILLTKSRDVSELMIGVSAAMTQLALLVGSPLVGHYIVRIGTRVSVFLGIALSSITFVACYYEPHPYLWLPLRFLFGIGIAFAYIAGEAWINRLAVQDRRGSLLGVYSTCVNCSFTLGLMVIPVLGSDGVTPFLGGAAIAAFLSMFLAFAPAAELERRKNQDVSAFRFILAAPILVGAILAFSAYEQAIMAFLPGFAVSHGRTIEQSATMMICSAVGSITTQIPIGRIIDKVGGRRILLFCAGMTAMGGLVLPFAIGNLWIAYGLFLAWGGIMSGLYTVALYQLGSQFSGHMLVAGNAAFAMAFGAGGFVGPMITGAVVQAFGAWGLPLTLALIFGMLFVTALGSPDRRHQSVSEESGS